MDFSHFIVSFFCLEAFVQSIQPTVGNIFLRNETVGTNSNQNIWGSRLGANVFGTSKSIGGESSSQPTTTNWPNFDSDKATLNVKRSKN